MDIINDNSSWIVFASDIIDFSDHFEFSGGITSLFRMVRSIWCVFIEFLLLIFVLAVTFVFHTFWTYQAQEATNQMQHFTKNFSIIGGLFIMSFGAGRFSLDGARRRSL